jgi:predicted MFS family arabinose efflux permease
MSDALSAFSPAKRPAAEFLLLIVLAIINFCHILDFMIMMPLGPQFMRAFSIDAKAFGLLVSVYSFSAAVAGFLAAFFIDRFDRRKALIFVFIGFLVGTFACAIAPNYATLMAARVVAGAFGGVAGGLVFAIIGDAVPAERRGEATGIVMGAFSLASVLGVPLGLWLSNQFEWHAPFFAIAGVSVAALAFSFKALPSMKGHLEKRSNQSAWQNILQVCSDKFHIRAFLFMSVLMMGGFSVIPFISAFLVSNAGMPETWLSSVYLFGGGATLLSSPLFGRLADKFGAFRVFVGLIFASLVPLLIMTNLGPSPIPLILVVSTLFMMMMAGRGVVAMTMVNAAVVPASRGSFMVIQASVTQMSSGLGSFLGAQIIVQSAGSPMVGYDMVGAFSAILAVTSLFLAKSLRRK